MVALCLVVLLFSFHIPVGPFVLAVMLALILRRVRMALDGRGPWIARG